MRQVSAPSAMICLRVADVREADVREAVSELREAGVTVDTEPHRIYVDADGAFGEKGREEWMAFIRDSGDNLIGLASRHAPAATS